MVFIGLWDQPQNEEAPKAYDHGGYPQVPKARLNPLMPHQVLNQ